MAYKLGVYGNHLFSRYDPAGNKVQVEQLQQSGFNYVNLALLHIDANASLYYNATPIVVNGVFANFPYLPELIDKLKSAGSVKYVFFTLGGSGSGDYNNVETLLSTPAGKAALIQSFGALTTALPIDGIDLDDEVTYNPPTTAELSQILAGPNNFGGLLVTYCPYALAEESQWNQALLDTWKIDQSLSHPQSVQWWNLQCYGGGTGNNPVSWADALPKDAGVKDRRAFIVPGFDPSSPVQSPENIRDTFRQFAGTGIDGGFIYTLESIPPQFTARQYADAIVEGLEGPPAKK